MTAEDNLSDQSCPTPRLLRSMGSKGLVDYRWFHYIIRLFSFTEASHLLRQQQHPKYPPKGLVTFMGLGLFWVGHLFNISSLANSFLSLLSICHILLVCILRCSSSPRVQWCLPPLNGRLTVQRSRLQSWGLGVVRPSSSFARNLLLTVLTRIKGLSAHRLSNLPCFLSPPVQPPPYNPSSVLAQ